MTEVENFQCQCGLCCATLKDWQGHREATQHTQFRQVSVNDLAKEAKRAIAGLQSFKQTTDTQESQS